jgi:hypothetical protein
VNSQDRQDMISDPLLATAMEDLRAEATYDVDWDRLRSTIVDGAALQLARRRAHRRSFAVRSFVPIALAASVAFALWIGPTIYDRVMDPAPAAGYAANVDDDVLMQALTADLSEQELLRLVNGSPEVLLAVAIESR